ncbi:MAG: alpha/beta hydrolase family protein, partial [Promethearchaeota archaeon]
LKEPDEWYSKRRDEILYLFKREVYGFAPETNAGIKIRGKIISEDHNVLEGNAIKIEADIYLEREGAKDNNEIMKPIQVLIYLPKKRKFKEGVPLFLGLNFDGNYTIMKDPTIRLPQGWVPNNRKLGISDNKPNENARGKKSRRWPVKFLIENGMGLATIYYGDLAPDHKALWKNGIYQLITPNVEDKYKWGAISVWAWGLSRVLDWFETQDLIDHEHVIVIGHSRLGKTALWAAAQDERFFAAISNDSGCGGAALSRRNFGETLFLINTHFPHWFCQEFHSYNHHVNDLPIDQHMLLSLIAPRPLYVASASYDLWADPLGEFLSLQHAAKVYKFLGLKIDEKLEKTKYPKIEAPIIGLLSHHIRDGPHDLLPYDWKNYVEFVKYNLGQNQTK